MLLDGTWTKLKGLNCCSISGVHKIISNSKCSCNARIIITEHVRWCACVPIQSHTGTNIQIHHLNNCTPGGTFSILLCLLHPTFLMQYSMPCCCFPALISEPDINQCSVMGAETQKWPLLIKGFNIKHKIDFTEGPAQQSNKQGYM